jgi:hypothetical protein
MSRRQRAAEDRFESLLDGRHPDDSALARVLSAASAPGTADELAGLAAARAAFVMAQQPRDKRAAVGLPGATRSAAGRLFVLKAVAAVSGATLVGGVAYAATGAHLLGGGPEHHRVHAPATSSHTAAAHGGHGAAPPYETHYGSHGGVRPTTRPAGGQPSAHETHGPTQTHSAHPPGPHNSESPGPTHSPNPHSTKSHSPHPSHSPKPHPASTRTTDAGGSKTRQPALRPAAPAHGGQS